MKKLLLASLLPILLIGCKNETMIEVKYSEVFGDPQIKMGFVELEVPNCTDPDTNLESSSVLEAKQKVGFVFPNSKFLKCFSQDFESFALFQIPVLVGGVGMMDCKPYQICISSSQNNQNLNVFVGTAVQQKVKKLTDGFTVFDPEDLKIRVFFENDSGKTQRVNIPSLFVFENGRRFPVHNLKGFPIENGKTIEFVLSNVATDGLFEMNPGVAQCMEFVDRELKLPPKKKERGQSE